MSDTMIKEINWGFEPTGRNAGLGGESSPSMPLDEAAEIGLGNPEDAANRTHDAFVKQTQRLYGSVSDVGGAVWDPRGKAALSDEAADYKTSGFDNFKQNRVMEESFVGGGGEPEVQRWAAPVDAHLDTLSSSYAGLAPETAAKMAEVMSKQDASVLSSIYLPQGTDPKIADKHGFVTSHGGLPADFINPSTGKLYQGLATSIDSVIQQGNPQLQSVDENGVVDKYAPGTGPYDTYARSIPGGIPASLRQPTPAEAQASPSMALQATDATVHGASTFTDGARPAIGFPWLIVLGTGVTITGIVLARRNRRRRK